MAKVSFKEAIKVWIRVAIYSFGGPAGQIAVMHKILVEEKNGSMKVDFFMHLIIVCFYLDPKHSNWLHTLAGYYTGLKVVLLPAAYSF